MLTLPLIFLSRALRIFSVFEGAAHYSDVLTYVCFSGSSLLIICGGSNICSGSIYCRGPPLTGALPTASPTSARRLTTHWGFVTHMGFSH